MALYISVTNFVRNRVLLFIDNLKTYVLDVKYKELYIKISKEIDINNTMIVIDSLGMR